MQSNVPQLLKHEREWLTLLSGYVATLAQCMRLSEKAGFNPSQPRAPRGTPTGGQWVPVGGGIILGESESSILIGGRGNDTLKPPASWRNKGTFGDHYNRHAKDFGDISAKEYADKAQQFRKHARHQGLPAVRSKEGFIKYYDPKTNTFGSYHPNGKTETFYKPSSRHYFENEVRNTVQRGGRITEPYSAPSGAIYKPGNTLPPTSGGGRLTPLGVSNPIDAGIINY